MRNKLLFGLRTAAFSAFAVFSGICAQAQYELDWNYDYSVAGNNYIEIVGTATDAASNYYVVANYYDTVDIDLGPGEVFVYPSNYSSMFIAKYNASGELIWGNPIGIVDASVIGYGMTVDAAGNVYVTGATGTEPGVNVDFDPNAGTSFLALGSSQYRFMWILKWDANGNFSWVRDIRTQTSTNNTGVIPQGIAVDNDGNVFVTGAWDRDLNFGPPSNLTLTSGDFKVSVFLAKYNSGGTFQWAKQFNQSYQYPWLLSGFFDKISVNSEGIYLAGSFGGNIDLNPGAGFDTLSTPQQTSVAVAIKLDSNGDYVWANKFLPDNASSQSIIYASTVDAAGNLYLGGAYSGTVDFDPTNNSNDISSVGNNLDMFMGKINTNGSLGWLKTIGAENTQYFSDIDLDELGNVFFVGTFEDTVDFDPGAGTEIMSAEALYDNFLLKLDNTGDFDYVRTWGGDGYDEPYTMLFDAAGDILISGYYTSTDMEFDPFRGGFSESWTYLMKLSVPNISVNEMEAEADFAVFPVPADQFVTVSGIESGSLIRVIDIKGKEVFNQNVNAETVQIATGTLANGLYVVKIESANFKDQKKIMVNH